MHDFAYHRARSLEDARAALRSVPEAMLLAGGLSLLPLLKQRLAQPSLIVDLSALEGLSDIRAPGTGEVAVIEVGALVTHGSLAADPSVIRQVAAAATLAGQIGDPQVRNQGTVGGAVAASDPAGDYPALLVALGAWVTTDRRRIPAEQFFVGPMTNALHDDEIITSVGLPVPERSAYLKFTSPSARYGLVGVCVAKGPAGVRVAVTGAAETVFRVSAMEERLERHFAPQALEGVTVNPATLTSDIHASARYRAHLIAVLARRAVAGAA